jgi:hypothetical protein
MKKISPILFLFSFVILVSCEQQQKGKIIENGSIKINLSPSSNRESLAEEIKISKIIRLQTIEKSIISKDYSIKRVLCENQKLYILDKRYSAIKVFDISGNYLYDLGSLGNRLGQFTNVQDICYYPPNNSIWVVCNTPKKIVEFSEKGKFVREIDLPVFASAMAFESKDRLYFYLNQNLNAAAKQKNIIVTNSLLKISDRLFDIPKQMKVSFDYIGNIFRTGETNYYNAPFDHVFYELKNGDAISKFTVDFGLNNTPKEFSPDSINNVIQNRSLLSQYFVVNQQYVGVKYYQKGSPLVSFYNLKTKNVLTSDTSLNKLNRLFQNSIFESKGEFMMLYNSDQLKDFVSQHSKEIRERYPTLYSYALGSKLHDNPLIILFNIK